MTKIRGNNQDKIMWDEIIEKIWDKTIEKRFNRTRSEGMRDMKRQEEMSCNKISTLYLDYNPLIPWAIMLECLTSYPLPWNWDKTLLIVEC